MNFILQEKKDSLGIITLNRPDKRNALNAVVIDELREVFTSFEADDEVKIIILRASGTVFSAGADLPATRSCSPTSKRHWPYCQRAAEPAPRRAAGLSR